MLDQIVSDRGASRGLFGCHHRCLCTTGTQH